MNRSWYIALMGATLAATPSAMGAQSLERLIASAGDGTVQFHFAARDGVCGNGRDFYRASEMGYSSSYSNGGNNDESCAKGPVRVVIVRAGREIIRIETYAGPLSSDPDGGKDLGVVAARDAAAYLLGLAATLDGRPAREAVQPAVLADSAVLTPQLSQLARDPARARDVRNSAIAWLARRRAEPGGVGATAVQQALDGIVRDRNESEAIRRQALSTVGNFERGEGIPLLIAFAGDPDTWIARQSLSSLANSGDPRARQFVRQALRRADLSAESRSAVIRGVGNEYASAADFKLLRDLYPSVNSDQERSTIINVIGNAGGTDNVNWLVAMANSPTETVGRRRQAISAMSRTDDPRVKEALKGLIDR
ncbi:MAG: HEAT repeat domain-containing protein [Gemmatimonadales bacterium]